MLSRLPPEVISDLIFPFLHVNDLLRLRRACKVSKDLADDYLRVYGTSERVVRIDLEEGSDEMSTFLALTYPINLTRFKFWKNDNSIWEWEEMQTFVDRYGGKMTHLEIDRLAIPLAPPAVQFFEGLPNLHELSIGYLEESKSDEEQGPQVEEPAPGLNLPSTFKRIKHLHVEQYTNRPQELFAFMEECSTNLEHVNYPYYDKPIELQVDPGDSFGWIRRIVERRHRENPDEPNLKYVDLKLGYYINPGDVRSFYRLVTTCSAHNVKLQNVDAEWIDEMMQLVTRDRGRHGDKISRCVVSIKDLTKLVFHLELPLLEQIHLGTLYCSMPEGDFERQPWGNLKELKLCVDSEYLNLHGSGEIVNVSRLFEFLFHGIRRENVETLELLFENDEILPYPDMSRVCSSCPNLKKLNLENWPGGNGDIAQLWGNLPLLEHVTFKGCRDLGDAAFIGDDVTRPALLEAKRLKSLRLEDLEEMPGITDTLFQSALRHMPLKKLYVGSTWGLVHSITLAGLESLLTGKFAETIEHFPLICKIELEGVTYAQRVELEGKFRSSQM